MSDKEHPNSLEEKTKEKREEKSASVLAQQAHSPAVVELFKLDAQEQGGGVYHFISQTSASVPGTSGPSASGHSQKPVSFKGDLYHPVPLEAEGFSWSTQGVGMRPQFRLGTVDSLILSLLESCHYFQGAFVQRIRTFSTFLEEEGLSEAFGLETYMIDTVLEYGPTSITWELVSKIDWENSSLPSRRILRDYCPFSYRYWSVQERSFSYENSSCPYTGEACYTTQGEKVTDPHLDRCGKRVEDCQRRFGKDLPFGGFPGARID